MGRVRRHWLIEVVRDFQCAAADAGARAADARAVLERVAAHVPPPLSPVERLILDGLVARGVLAAGRRASRRSGLVAPDTGIAEAAMRLLETRYTETWTYERLGRALGRDAEYIERCFHRRYSDSLHAQLTAIRLSHAYVLAAAGQKIESLAASVGFRSRSAFFKAFNRKYGCSPGAVRHTHERKPD